MIFQPFFSPKPFAKFATLRPQTLAMAPILLLFLYVLSISSSSADISKATVTEGVVNEGATQECPSCDNVLEQERVKFESIMDKEREVRANNERFDKNSSDSGGQ